MRTAQNIPRVLAQALRAALKDVRVNGGPVSAAASLAGYRTYNTALDSLAQIAEELEQIAATESPVINAAGLASIISDAKEDRDRAGATTDARLVPTGILNRVLRRLEALVSEEAI